jgi:hypothetical protein
MLSLVEFQNGTTKLRPNISNVLIIRQLQKANCDINFGEHTKIFVLECNRYLAQYHKQKRH